MLSSSLVGIACVRYSGSFTPMHFLRVLLLSLMAFFPLQAAAQQQDLFNLFGGLIRSGIAAATQADWERLPTPELACIDRALSDRGSSINELVRQGISP